MNKSVPGAHVRQNDILTVKSLNNVYSKNGIRRHVLKDVSFTIRRGEAFGLVGESGCGKSTLCNAVAGLIPSSGDVYIENEKITPGENRKLSRIVQLIFQDPLSSLNPRHTVGWILEEPLKIHAYGGRRERAARVDEVLELVGLDAEYKTRRPAELSGGQRQRVGIAAALMLNPPLILADEPVSALDVSIQAQVLNLLRDLHDRLHLSYLFISHDLDVVYYLCDRVAVMYDGRIIELAPARALYDNPLHPYTVSLLKSSDPFSGISGQAEISPAISGGGCPYRALCPQSQPRCESLPDLTDAGGGHFVRCGL